MNRVFRLIKPAPLLVQVRSREACTYMNRVMIFVCWTMPEMSGIKRYLWLLWKCFIYVFTRIYLPIGFMLSLIIDSKNFTAGEFLSVVQITLNALGGCAKAFILEFSLSRLRKTESKLDILDEGLQKDEERRKIHRSVAQCNRIFLIYGKLYLGYSISMLIAGLLCRQPPWLVYNPLFDWRNGVVHFWVHFILEYIISSMAVAIQLIADTYTVVFIIIFRTHVDILKGRIRNLRSDPLKTQSENYEELVNCIIYHKLILDCCNLLRPVVSRTIFIQFLLVGVLLGVTIINLWYFSDFYRGISTIVYLTGIVLQTFPFCYLCDLLVEDYKDLSNLLGQSNWVDAEPSYKSTLRIFMQHLQQPTIFSAGGVFPISIGSNIRMAKFAFSVITIIEKVNLVDRFQ